MDDNFKKLRAYLIDLAVKGHSDNYETIVNYSNVDFCLSNDNSKLIKYLTEILEFEYSNGRPLITVLATAKGTNLPKEYFFDLVKKNNIYPKYVDNSTIIKIERENSFKYWRDYENLKNYKNITENQSISFKSSFKK